MPTLDEFTGERFLPQCSGEIWAEHWHRYLFAAAHVAGCDVLDAACGEGYGAALLARHAKSVIGLDIDGPTIAAARAKYAVPALRFAAGSVTAMPFADASFDCVVSFETLEHLAEQQAMLAEMRRVLRPQGVLIISTPDRVEYSDKRDFHNEFHVRELSEAEFRDLLGRYFGAQRWYGQRLVFNSALWPLPTAAGTPMDTGTLDESDAAFERMIDPEFVEFAFVTQPVEIEVRDGETRRLVGLYQCEGRTRHVFVGVAGEEAGERGRECRFAGAEITIERDEVARARAGADDLGEMAESDLAQIFETVVVRHGGTLLTECREHSRRRLAAQ